MNVDERELEALVTFARIEVESRDVEPWADIMTALQELGAVNDEEAFWLVKMYNAYDSFHSAWSVFRRWPGPYHWARAKDRDEAAQYDCTQERRGLRGGRVLKHLDDYVHHLAGQTQRAWLTQGILRDGSPQEFGRLTAWMRQVWGVGRQTAFEWAEFSGKVNRLPIKAADAQLWESEGPRRSLQKLYGNPNPTPDWLNDRAAECRQMLADRGVSLDWEDFETIICDFNVMRDGRYYPGRHLAALREEIDDCPPEDHDLLMEAFNRIVPESWRSIAPGIRKDLLPVYKQTGRIILEP